MSLILSKCKPLSFAGMYPLGGSRYSFINSIMKIFHEKIQLNHTITSLLPHPMQAIRAKLYQPTLFHHSAAAIRYSFILLLTHSLTHILTHFCCSSENNSISITMNKNKNDVLQNSIFLSSTMKKRRTKMNKHKLKKRRKLLKMNTKASREA